MINSPHFKQINAGKKIKWIVNKRIFLHGFSVTVQTLYLHIVNTHSISAFVRSLYSKTLAWNAQKEAPQICYNNNIHATLLFAFLCCMCTYPSWFFSPSRPGGLWRSGTTSWCTAVLSPPHPQSDIGPDLLPGLRGSTSASLWAPDTWSCTLGSHSIQWATTPCLSLLEDSNSLQPQRNSDLL